jgi:3-dehydroquinate dehydratase type I
MICACVGPETVEQAIADLAEARRQGADLAELRADYLKDPDFARILSAKPLPVLVTVRPKWEAGRFEGSEADRTGLLEEACLHGADYVDVEYRAYKDFNRRQAKVILSYHDFERTPEDLEKTAARMGELEPLVV